MTILFGEGLRRITYPGFYGNKLPNLYYLDISGGLNAFYTAVFRQLHRDKKLSFKTGLMFFFFRFFISQFKLVYLPFFNLQVTKPGGSSNWFLNKYQAFQLGFGVCIYSSIQAFGNPRMLESLEFQHSGILGFLQASWYTTLDCGQIETKKTNKTFGAPRFRRFITEIKDGFGIFRVFFSTLLHPCKSRSGLQVTLKYLNSLRHLPQLKHILRFRYEGSKVCLGLCMEKACQPVSRRGPDYL